MPTNSTVRNLFSKSRLLESGSPAVVLSESELYALLLVICKDLAWDPARLGLDTSEIPGRNYYEIELDWFHTHGCPPSIQVLQQALARGVDTDGDFGLYFLNLCSLHKRRLKYQRILCTQPKPTMDQVGPRGLLEYGICADSLLNSWLIWRKWIFDIDNRAGQETGYLFEPILASSLGGESVGSTHSPVKRLDENGRPKSTGRQIDCYIGAENAAYEFKLRVTVAASGQGRFGEELSFPRECRAAGIKPILVVLDPTPSNRLTELSKAFNDNGGAVYVGAEAWAHLEEKSGPVMSRFIDNYIKPPLKAMNQFDTAQLVDIRLTWKEGEITIRGDNTAYILPRK